MEGENKQHYLTYAEEAETFGSDKVQSDEELEIFGSDQEHFDAAVRLSLQDKSYEELQKYNEEVSQRFSETENGIFAISREIKDEKNDGSVNIVAVRGIQKERLGQLYDRLNQSSRILELIDETIRRDYPEMVQSDEDDLVRCVVQDETMVAKSA